MNELPVGIIGAGPAGMAMGAAFGRKGIPFRILDAGRGFGGIWDIGRTATPMYETAHFISSKTRSAFPGHPMPDDYPDYPRHDLVLRYLEDYATQHALAPHTRFGVEVVRAEHDGPAGAAGAAGAAGGAWRVTHAGGEVERFAALCVATGANWYPREPAYAGAFDGEAWHAFRYRGPGDFRGRRVLIVGCGNSAADLACDAAVVADHASISVRRGYRFVPKYVFGKPADVFAHSGPKLPPWLERRLFQFLLDRVLVGDVTRFGLPRPDHDLLASHPVMNTRVLHHLGHGDLVARPDIERLHGERVRFADGTSEAFDLIVWATGYERRVPFLEGEPLEPQAPDGGGLYLNLFSRSRPDLFFLGVFETDGAAFPLLGLQAELVAEHLAARLGDPDRARRLDERRTRESPDLKGGRRYLDTPRHAWYVQFDAYEALLDDELRRARASRTPRR